MQRINILGETTYDIIFKNNKPMEAKVGGSQLNTAVSLGRVQLPVSFITQIGNDRVGNICFSFLQENGIEISFVKRTHGNSRLALAFLDEKNNAGYDFFKAENAVSFNFPEINENDIILFGSSFSLREDIRAELIRFLSQAKEKNAIIIYDPNFRKDERLNLAERLKMVHENIQLSNIIKGSDEDFINIFGIEAAEIVWKEISKTNVEAMLYTAGKNGVKVYWGNKNLFIDVPAIKPVSTIGAGDNFNAGLIFSLFKKKLNLGDIKNLSSKDWKEITELAVSFAQDVCLSYDNYISVEYARDLIKH